MALKEKTSKTYLVITGAIATTALTIGGYYLYRYFTYDCLNDLIDEAMLETIGKLKSSLKELIDFPNNEKRGEKAFQTTIEIHKLSRKYYEFKYPHQDDKRRKAIDDSKLYSDYCYKTISLAQQCNNVASEKILKLLDNIIDLDQLSNWVIETKQDKIEEYSNEYLTVKQSDSTIPSGDILKEAYKYYADLLKEEYKLLKSLQINNDSGNDNDDSKQQMLFYSLIIQLKVEDKLFIKFNLTEELMRYGLKVKTLMNDPFIVNIQTELKTIMPMMMQ